MTLIDQHGCLIGDIEITGVDSGEEEDTHFPGVEPVIEDDIKIPGVDVEGPEASAPQSVYITDPNIPQDEPAPIHVVPTQEVPAPQASEPVTEPAQAPCLHRSTRVRFQDKPAYTPSMTGSKYSYAVTQIEIQGVINPYAHMFVQEDFYQAEPDVVPDVMTQISLKAGFNQWGTKAFTADHSDMKQLDLRKTFKPKHWRELTASQRQIVLASHTFLKDKRDGKVKVRTVAGGNNQQDYISKECSSSRTFTTESVLLSCIIDAEEG
jgi:hypothetical protein